MFILKVCFLGTLGEPSNPHNLPHSLLTVMKTVKKEDHYIVRLQPGFMNTDEPDEYDSLPREWSREFCNNIMTDDYVSI